MGATTVTVANRRVVERDELNDVMAHLERMVVDLPYAVARHVTQGCLDAVVNGSGIGPVDAEWQADRDLDHRFLAGEPGNPDQEDRGQQHDETRHDIQRGPDMVHRMGEGGHDG